MLDFCQIHTVDLRSRRREPRADFDVTRVCGPASSETVVNLGGSQSAISTIESVDRHPGACRDGGASHLGRRSARYSRRLGAYRPETCWRVSLLVLTILPAALAVSSAAANAQDPSVPPAISAEQELHPAQADEIADLFPAERQTPNPASSQAAPKVMENEDQLLEWLSALGANKFSVRERAAGHLNRLGPTLVPRLMKISQESPDPEVRVRAEQLAARMIALDEEKKLSAFVSRENDALPGWSTARKVLGDSPESRELYVELMKAHPTISRSLEGSPQERMEAMDGVVHDIQRGFLIRLISPTRADLMALILPANDRRVNVSRAVEMTIIQMLRNRGAREILVDPKLGDIASTLLVGCFDKMSFFTRSEVLWIALDIELPGCFTSSQENTRTTRPAGCASYCSASRRTIWESR